MINNKKYKINLFLLLVVLFICTIKLFGQATPQISIAFEIYDDAGGQKTHYFGLDQTATESIDIHLGESDLPPYPPTGAFDTRFLLPENNFAGTLSSYNDYRFASGFPFSGTVEYRVRYQGTEGATIMNFGWNFPPEVTGLLQDIITGTIVNVPLSGSGTYGLTNFTSIDRLKLFIYYNNIITDVKNDLTGSETFYLSQNYPNPFNPSTVIEFSIPQYVSYVSLAIYNTLGEKIDELVSSSLEAGLHRLEWKAKDVPSGSYIYQLKADNFVASGKMMLLK